MVNVEWKGDLVFEAAGESGAKFKMDTYPEEGQTSAGPTPFEAFLSGAAACSAIDVMLILSKKRQKVTSYRVEIDGERTEEGVYPRPYTSLVVKHYLKGENLDQAAVEQAVKLSDEKYCSAVATLRQGPSVRAEWVIEA